MSILPHLDVLKFWGLKNIKLSRLCLFLTASAIWGSEHLKNKEAFYNVFLLCKSLLWPHYLIFNFEVNSNENFRTIGILNIFSFCP